MANKQQIEGEYDKARGRVKVAAGELTGDRKLTAEGAMEQIKGSVKKGVGNLKQAARNLTDESA